MDSSDKTEMQPEDSRSSSGRLSAPKEVEQNPGAPKIPGYVLVSPLGSGAFAQVWKAWQSRTHKWVAVKVFTQRSGVNWLFLQREVERLIRLDKHPHIVSLLDADLEGELPYYVMDYMEGGSLEAFVDPRNAAPGAKAALWMEEIAEALAYVHAKGLIHCDLKPANVLLDEEGHVRLADFGQSRIVTDSSGALGTLFYMAPEQSFAAKAGAPLQPDVRWDVYGLGATMWAILAGRAPRGDSAGRGKIEDAPSLDLRLAAYRELVEGEALQDCRTASSGRADEDLGAVVDCCARAKPESRYAGVGEVLGDLAARKESRPVKPLAGGRAYRLRKFLKRNAALAALAAFAAAALAGAFVQILRERNAARRELASSYISRARMAREEGDPAAALLFYAHANKIFPTELARRNAQAVRAELATPTATFDGSRFPGAVVVSLSPDFRILFVAGKEPVGGGRLLDWETKKSVAEIAYQGRLRSAAFSADGKFLATATDAGELRLWESRTGRPVGAIMREPPLRKGEIAMVRMFVIGDAETDSMAVGPGGKTLFAGVYESQARVWDVAHGVTVGSSDAFDVVGLNAVALSPDGRTAATAAYASAELWNAASGESLGELEHAKNDVLTAAFSPDGRSLVTGGADGLQLWDVVSRTRKNRWTFGKAVIRTAAFDATGGSVVFGTTDGRAAVWNLREGKLAGKWMMHPGEVRSAAFSPDGQTIWTRSGLVLRSWASPLSASASVGRERTFTIPGYYPHLRSATFSRDGSEILTVAEYETELLRWDARKLQTVGAGLKPPKPGGESVRRFVFSPDRSVALLSYYDKTTRLWDLKDGKWIGPPASHEGTVDRAVFSPDGKTVLTIAWNGGVRLFDVHTSSLIGKSMALGDEVHHAAFSPDGRFVLTAGKTSARLWDARGGSPAGPPLSHDRFMFAVAVSPDGKTLFTSSGERIRRWDARTFQPVGRDMDSPETSQLAFSPDGKTLLAASHDHQVRLWDAETGLPIGKAMKHDGLIHSAEFRPDGKIVLTASGDKTARLWDARTGEPLGEPMAHKDAASFAEFSPDGRSVLSGEWSSGGIHLWDASWLDEDVGPDAILKDAESAAFRRVNERGDVEAAPEGR